MEQVTHSNPDITLVTDGGPENNLKLFPTGLGQSIEHKIALVDVHYSNSLIEAHNKILKYYLFHMDIPDREHLIRIFPSIVEDFNNRPHIALDGLTPDEAEQNLSLNREQIRLYTINAAEERKKYNRIHLCNHCTS